MQNTQSILNGLMMDRMFRLTLKWITWMNRALEEGVRDSNFKAYYRLGIQDSNFKQGGIQDSKLINQFWGNLTQFWIQDSGFSGYSRTENCEHWTVYVRAFLYFIFFFSFFFSNGILLGYDMLKMKFLSRPPMVSGFGFIGSFCSNRPLNLQIKFHQNVWFLSETLSW